MRFVFSLKDFLMKTIIGMIGNYPDFQVREYGLKWLGKGLTEDDLAEIDALIEAQYIEPPVVEEPIEDIPTEETETEDETILDEEGTETEGEESQTETEIIEDSTNEEEPTEPTE